MKDPGSSRYLLLLMFMLILTIGLATSTDTSSFWKKKATIYSTRHSGQVPNTEIPSLSQFTACLDIFLENYATSTAFSYCVQDEVNPELGVRRENNKLEVFHLGKAHQFTTDLKPYVWHTVCLKWMRQTKLLEVYVNKTRVYNAKTKDRMLQGNGSLVLGALHTNREGQIHVTPFSNMNGNLYNYQMWNYTRFPEELPDCMEGNLISWTKKNWKFERIEEDERLRCASNSVIPTSTASTTTPTTTLGTTTATRTPTPAQENSASTEIFPERFTSLTSTPGIFPTSVTQKQTANSNSSDISSSTRLPPTPATSPSEETDLHTKVSTTESSPGNNLQTNSSIRVPTGNNVSTTGNTSSTHHGPPGLRTTTAVPISSWKNSSTIQQQSTGAKSTPDPPVISTTTTLYISTQLNKTPEPMNGTTPLVVITSPTTKSITPSTVTNVSSASSSSSLSTNKSSIETSTVITSSSTPALTSHTNGVTVSPVSESGATYITSASSTNTSASNNVTFYIVHIMFTSTDVMDEDMATSLIQSMMYQFLNNTEFAAVQIIVSQTVSNEPGNVPAQTNNQKKRETNEDSGDSNPPGYMAKSIVCANSSSHPNLLADQLEKLLMKGFTDPQLNLSLTAQNVTTGLLDAEHCSSESTNYNDFTYEWPKTKPTEKATLQCHTNPNEMATRDCYINVTTLNTEWGVPDYSKCVPSSFEELENVIVTPENANYLALQILNMTMNAPSLPAKDIKIILQKMSEIIALGEIDLENAKVHMDVINFILLKADGSLRLFTNKILNLMEEVGFKMDFSSDTANVTSDSMALLVSKKFEQTYFTVATYSEGNVEITLEPFPSDKAVAYIHLPKSIQDEADTSSSKVQFNFIGSLSPFQDYEPNHLVLSTYIISASFEGTNVKDLKEPINISLRHVQENVEDFPAECVFWDFTKNDNMGGWNTSGCRVTFNNKEYTTCSCNHLTHFGVLLDISRTPIDPLNEHILSLLTYVGCGIASLFLGLALVTYGMFNQLRRDYPSKILMNLSFSLLMLNLLFLVNNWLSSFRIQGLCISTAALLHYFLLTSITWMGLEAVHMYFAFVKVFNSYIHKYILKLCVAGWGIPLVVVVVVLSTDVNFYGSISDKKSDVPGDNDALFCWIQNDIVFYVAVVSYFGVIFLTNISMFVVVLIQIKSLKCTRLKDWKALFLHDIKSTLSLAFLLGLTWGFIFFAWGPVRVAFLYLFAIFNTLQGFFIFVFHCLIKENVRRHWRMFLCCGKCRLDNSSDWSRLSNAEAKYNGCINLTPSDLYQSTRSNNTASTSNASSLSSLSIDGFYGKSYVNGGIFISSAHTAPSYHATVYPDNRRISFLD